MKKRKPPKKQLDLFSGNPESMQWHDLSETNRQNLQPLLAQLIMSLFSQHHLKIRESHHAIEN